MFHAHFLPLSSLISRHKSNRFDFDFPNIPCAGMAFFRANSPILVFDMDTELHDLEDCLFTLLAFVLCVFLFRSHYTYVARFAEFFRISSKALIISDLTGPPCLIA